MSELTDKLKQRGKFSAAVITVLNDEYQGTPNTDNQVWSSKINGDKQWVDNGINPGFRVTTVTVETVGINISHNGAVVLFDQASPDNTNMVVSLGLIPEGAMEFAIRFQPGVATTATVTRAEAGVQFPELAAPEINYYYSDVILSTKNMVHCFTSDGINWFVTGSMGVNS